MLEKRTYEISFMETILGGVPLDRETYRQYITGDDPNFEDELESVPETGYLTTGFHKDEQGCFILDYVVKGFLKEAGNVVKDILKIKALKSKIDNRVFIFPRKIRLADKPSGILKRPLRTITMQGPRTFMAQSEYIELPINIRFEIGILHNNEVTFDIIDKVLEYGQYKGLGQWRNGGYGKFTAKCIGGVQCETGDAVITKDASKKRRGRTQSSGATDAADAER